MVMPEVPGPSRSWNPRTSAPSSPAAGPRSRLLVLLASSADALHVSRHSVHLCAQEYTMSKPNLDTDMLHGCAHVSALLHACMRATLSGGVYLSAPIWDKNSAETPNRKSGWRRGAHSGPYHPLSHVTCVGRASTHSSLALSARANSPNRLFYSGGVNQPIGRLQYGY